MRDAGGKGRETLSSINMCLGFSSSFQTYIEANTASLCLKMMPLTDLVSVWARWYDKSLKVVGDRDRRHSGHTICETQCPPARED